MIARFARQLREYLGPERPDDPPELYRLRRALEDLELWWHQTG